MGPQPNVSFGQTGISLKVDFTPVASLSKEQSSTYVKETCLKLVPGKDVSRRLSTLDDEGQLRMAHAMALYESNRVPGSDDAQAIEWLLKWGRLSKALPGDSGQRFEREALSASGLVKRLLINGLAPLTDKTVAELESIYSPAYVSTGTGTVRKTPPLKIGLLRNGLFRGLTQLVDGQIAYFEPGKGVKLQRDSMDWFKEQATHVQDYVKFECGPYPLANPDSGLLTGYELSTHLESTEAVQLNDRRLLGYLLNRAQVVGYGSAYGKPFATADFDGLRDEDALYDLMGELLRKPGMRDKVGRCLQLTGSHSSDGTIRMNPVIPPETSIGRTELRWNQLRTLIHEFLHHLSHPDFNDKADTIGHGQIIDEGFVDMITAIIFRQLADEIGKKPEMAERFLRIKEPAKPSARQLTTGYAEAGKGADQITGKIGQDRAYAGFFLGATKFLGFKK
ncbi:hypothetical protein [Nonomuraea insulae]|uniref:Uncharacterized protein n=1 Tax=Nonomuraea insulae TaxID=1616787 RepID=A0ABW1CDW3_9ACTN